MRIGGERVKEDLLTVVVDRYRREGPMQHGVPTSELLAFGEPESVAQALGILIDLGALEGRSGGVVVLAKELRLAVLTRPVLEWWVLAARQHEELARAALMASARGELRSLVSWAQRAPRSDTLTERAAQLAGALTMADLNAEAMDVVAGLRVPGGDRPIDRLRFFAAMPDGRFRSVKELRASLRRDTPQPAETP